jgi:hypothetical protein
VRTTSRRLREHSLHVPPEQGFKNRRSPCCVDTELASHSEVSSRGCFSFAISMTLSVLPPSLSSKQSSLGALKKRKKERHGGPHTSTPFVTFNSPVVLSPPFLKFHHIFLQSLWRGHVVRRSTTSRQRAARQRIERATARLEEPMTLGSRTTAALRVLLASKQVSHALHACAAIGGFTGRASS